jgi:glycogen operon protein
MNVIAAKLETGLPYPLGASAQREGVNFAVFSEHASAIELCVFDGGREMRLPLLGRTDQVWHGFLAGAGPGLTYGLRAQGPWAPADGQRFNPNKLLLDPYATRLSGALPWNDVLIGGDDQTMDLRDSAGAMVKAIVETDSYDWSGDRAPRTPLSDTVIYEAHVKGLTKLMPEIDAARRGTYAALGDPSLIRHFKRIGITAVELLPIHAVFQDERLVQMGLRNYWGYNTLGFFVPELAYGAADPANELRGAVRALHAAGIELILDVVYNHTCEGDDRGPTLSWRGLDNASYYRLAENPARYVNDTGTGNTINASHPRVIQMMMDSLRYWVRSFHIDGFRFDLATTLGRETSGYDPQNGFFDALRQDPLLSTVKLIAEPWDIGPAGYQLGNHPGFAEWNDQYRDTVRRTWRGDAGQRAPLAIRLMGSADIFAARQPTASVNYVTCHDGATLADLVSYEGKYNQANGEDNRDGISDNLASNWGVEGPSTDAAITARRKTVQRSMLMTLLASLGTPMLLAGDEFGRSQKGNNNAYCQDNEISWLDWSLAETNGDLIGFTADLVRLRKQLAPLRAEQYATSREIAPGVKVVAWLDESGRELAQDDWDNGEGRALTLIRSDGKTNVALVMNPSDGLLEFRLPDNLSWRVLASSQVPPMRPKLVPGLPLAVPPQVCVLLAART